MRVVAERLAAQLLSGPPAPDPVAVAQRLLAVQAQDPRGARLAVRSRTSGLTTGDVDRALNDRSLIVNWLIRGTLHLVRSEDYPWLHALTAPTQAAGNARRLREEGVSEAAAERGVAIVERSLADEGPLTRAQLRERLDTGSVPTGQALVHVLNLATLRGIAVRGPMAGKEQAFALVRDWLPAPPRFDRDSALAELARRYLAGHGPANDRDLQKWAGLRLTDVRAGLRAIASELDERDDGLLALRGRAADHGLPPPRLLGAFDPVLLGWASREPILGDRQGIVTVNGLFRPFALVDGKAAGIWRLVERAPVLEPFEPLTPEDAEALEADAADVERFLA